MENSAAQKRRTFGADVLFRFEPVQENAFPGKNGEAEGIAAGFTGQIYCAAVFRKKLIPPFRAAQF